MTEQQWLECTDPMPMLEFLRGKASDRKLRLFACACHRDDGRCRQYWGNREKQTLEEALEKLVIQRPGKAKTAEAAWENAAGASELALSAAGLEAPTPPASMVGPHWERWFEERAAKQWSEGKANEKRTQCDFLRDIFGTLFRPFTINTSWRTESVVNLSQVIYDKCRFADMAMLADALENAGCTNADILMHCRQPGVHVRGCWCLDLILGKE